MGSIFVKCSPLVILSFLATTISTAFVPIHNFPIAEHDGRQRADRPSLIPMSMLMIDRRSAIATVISNVMPLLLVTPDDGSSAPSSSPVIENSGGDSVQTTTKFTTPKPYSNPRAITTIRLDSPTSRLGLELYDVAIGTPPRIVAAVRSVRRDGQGFRGGAERGMILPDFADAQSVVDRVAAGTGPYPIELRLYNLALGGDGIGDLGRSIVSAEDALDLATRASSSNFYAGSVGGGDGGVNGLVIDTIRPAEGKCGTRSRRGDTMEIKYEARIGDRNGPVYDSSEWRGTGQPFAYMLGDNDIIKGADLGTYDMCPGEVRELSIPPELGYGARGSRLFKTIGSNAKLWWRVELVGVNFITEDKNENPREELY